MQQRAKGAVRRRPPASPNAIGAVLLILAGVLAFGSGFASWGRVYGAGVGGLELVQVLETLSPEGYTPVVGQAITGVVVGGVIVVLCGCLMLAPLRTHRPVGTVAALVTVVMVVAVVVVAVKLGDLFAGGVGAWLFVLGPALALLGSVAGTVRR